MGNAQSNVRLAPRGGQAVSYESPLPSVYIANTITVGVEADGPALLLPSSVLYPRGVQAISEEQASQKQPVPRADFARVDDAAAPQLYAQCLERAQRNPAIAAMKAKSYAELRAGSGMRLLDVGCGIGGDVRALAELVGSEGAAVGIDNSERLLEVARQRSADDQYVCEYYHGDMHHLPFAENSFDGCRTERVLIHSSAPRDVVGEIVRVMKPRGRIVLLEPDLESVKLALSDRTLARRWTNWHCDSVRSGTIGRYLAGMLVELELRDIQVTPEVRIDRDGSLDSFSRLMRLAVAQHVFTSEESTQLEGDVARRIADRQYFEYGVFFLVSAEKA